MAYNAYRIIEMNNDIDSDTSSDNDKMFELKPDTVQ